MALLADQSADVNSNLTTGTGSQSVVYTVPGNVPVKVESVVATITNAAASAVTPELTIRDQSGVVIARKAQRTTIPAGDAGTATFALRLDDDGAVTPATPTLADVILAHSPAGFWKLNEAAGSIAADSSGNAMDLSTAPPELDPLWGQAAGPPGELAASFDNGTSGFGGTASRVSRSWPVINSDFTAGVWVNRDAVAGTMVFGQGNPERGGGLGWQFSLYSSGLAPPRTSAPNAQMAGAGTALFGSAALAVGTWAFLAMTYDATATVFRLYVDGVLQQTSAPFVFTPVPIASPLWIGHDGGLGGNAIALPRFTGSYAFLIMSVLSAADVLAINDAAGP